MDCQIDYSYEYDEHDNWVVLKLYCSELRKLLGDFIIIQKDAEGKTYTEDRRVISYYETEVGNEETIKNKKQNDVYETNLFRCGIECNICTKGIEL